MKKNADLYLMIKSWLLIICIFFIGCNARKTNDKNNPQINEAEQEGDLHYFTVTCYDHDFYSPEDKTLYILKSFYVPAKTKDSKHFPKNNLSSILIPAEQAADLPDIKNIEITGTIKDLSFLKDFTKIKYLYISSYTSFPENNYGYYTGILEPLKYLVNLEELVIDIQPKQLHENDLSPIGSLTQLKKLSLDFDCSDLLNLEPLRSLVNLEELSLYNIKINDLSFMENMKKLKRFHVSKDETINIDPIGKLTNLERLTMWSRNGDININPVGKLTNLKNLILACSNGRFISSSDIFAHLAKLEELYISICDDVDLNFIGVLPKLYKLKIESTYVDISLLNNPELKYLTIDPFYKDYKKAPKCKDIDDLTPLLKLPNLERIIIRSFSDVNIFLPLIESNSIKSIYIKNDYYRNFPVKEFEKRGIEIDTDKEE